MYRVTLVRILVWVLKALRLDVLTYQTRRANVDVGHCASLSRISASDCDGVCGNGYADGIRCKVIVVKEFKCTFMKRFFKKI